MTPTELAVQKLDPEFAQPQETSIIQYAIERGAGIDTIERLIALKRQEESDAARRAYNAAFNAFKASPVHINKNKHVDFTGKTGLRTNYKHATLDNVCDVIGAALAQHKLSYRWETKQDGVKITVTCILSHELGHSESTSLFAEPDQTGNKNSIQAVGSTVTYLQRYTLLALTGMATTDQDTDGRITPAQAEQMPAVSEEQEIRLQEWADALRQCATEAQLKNIFADAYKFSGTVSAHAKSEMTRVYNECKARLK
jgi:hypothetical protein